MRVGTRTAASEASLKTTAMGASATTARTRASAARIEAGATSGAEAEDAAVSGRRASWQKPGSSLTVRQCSAARRGTASAPASASTV